MGEPVGPVRLHLDEGACTGCLSCVVVCAERHTGQSSLSRSRIQVTVDPLSAAHSGRYCRQCRKAPCAAACPAGAIRFDSQYRVWLVDEPLCTGCGLCVEACPFQAMWLDPSNGLALKCDLCRDAAWCVEVCPAGALSVKGREQGRSHGR